MSIFTKTERAIAKLLGEKKKHSKKRRHARRTKKGRFTKKR
jgi:hypothetical protein